MGEILPLAEIRRQPFKRCRSEVVLSYMQEKIPSHTYVRDAVKLQGVGGSKDMLEGLRAMFHAPSYQPPLLPAAAIELIALSRKTDVTVAEVVQLVERDPFIAGRVLQVAQSARYCSAGGVPSLQHATVRLGLDTMTNIFLEVAMHMRVFRAPGYEEPMAKLRRHSVATANVARIVCRYTSIYDDYAFLCGLLHDVGIAACMILLGEARAPARGSFALEWPAIRRLHGEASRFVCETWRLPADIGFAVAHHHDAGDGHVVHPVASAIAVAEGIACQIGFGFENEAAPAPAPCAVKALGLSEGALASIVTEAKSKVSQLVT